VRAARRQAADPRFDDVLGVVKSGAPTPRLMTSGMVATMLKKRRIPESEASRTRWVAVPSRTLGYRENRSIGPMAADELTARRNVPEAAPRRDCPINARRGRYRPDAWWGKAP